MERVAFLIEETNERIGCLLNPESVVLRRSAGVRTRRSAAGALTGAGLADDPLLFTGGGQTELELDLLFDVTLLGSSTTTGDVRDLTRPLWNLTENSADAGGRGRPPLVRFIWGKAWNVPGVVVAVAERLEQFTAEGVPRRSWLRMRFRRVEAQAAAVRAGESVGTVEAEALLDSAAPALTALREAAGSAALPEEAVETHQLLGGGEEGPPGERLDQIAGEAYGDPGLWRVIAAFNDIADPLHLAAGTLLRIPPLGALTRALSTPPEPEESP